MSVIPGEGNFLFQAGNNVIPIRAIGENGKVTFHSTDGARVVGDLLNKLFATMCMSKDGKSDARKGIVTCGECSKHCQLSRIFANAAVSAVTRG